ncbi:class A beta-lactamase-related serine hydrolase [Rhizobiaceae bacterium BDR2-2]|uniref:Class A beta-lactamase-related serine hydrolase n=2 Tax=Ectorhizobium quercum TaxID=2965071 RepID=A0AAE3MWC1_9HYPH|nr:class A beta-lactamase-related serine hydrolase [Ectorhizobium quercum]
MALSAGLIGGAVLPASAGEAEVETIEAVYADPAAAGARFSEGFLQAVPLAQIAEIVESMRARYGPAAAVREEAGGYAIETASHRIPVEIALDAEGRITGLFFRAALPLGGDITETLAAISELPGTVSYLVRSGDAVLHGRNGGEKLAVGSAFKLGILKVLIDDIAVGKRKWEDVVRLQAQDKSLPSGTLQRYPDGSPFTLHTLAAAMIANSDNTATDVLIRVLGAERIAETLGLDALPTTRAFFTLKADGALAARYRENPAERADILAGLAGRPLPDPVRASVHHTPGVEWYVDAATLCELALSVREADVFALNPGPVNAGRWAGVAFKGGSEAGVLNLTAALTGHDRRSRCVSLTVNSDTTIDETRVAELFAALAEQLAAPGD